jgi:hypothetical protein
LCLNILNNYFVLIDKDKVGSFIYFDKINGLEYHENRGYYVQTSNSFSGYIVVPSNHPGRLFLAKHMIRIISYKLSKVEGEFERKTFLDVFKTLFNTYFGNLQSWKLIFNYLSNTKAIKRGKLIKLFDAFKRDVSNKQQEDIVQQELYFD